VGVEFRDCRFHPVICNSLSVGATCRSLFFSPVLFPFLLSLPFLPSRLHDRYSRMGVFFFIDRNVVYGCVNILVTVVNNHLPTALVKRRLINISYIA